MSFKALVKASLGWSWQEGAIDNDRLDYTKQLLPGPGNNQAEAVWHAENQLLPHGVSLALDLSDLRRTILGDVHVVTLLSVKALLIVNASAAGGTLLLGGAQADEWSAPLGADGDQIAIPPDGALLLTNGQAGWTVDDGQRNMRLAAVGGDVTYSIAIVGTTTNAGAGSNSDSGSASVSGSGSG